MFATENEIQQYARMTFKQHGLEGYELVFLPRLTRRLGQANPWEKRIELSLKCLESFYKFKKVLLHEIFHCLQFYRMGKTFKVNGRNQFHGKVWKQICREHNFDPSTRI